MERADVVDKWYNLIQEVSHQKAAIFLVFEFYDNEPGP